MVKNVELPLCWRDGKPCLYNLNCEISFFGCMAKNGVEEVIWFCPRFKTGSSKVKK